MHKKKENVLTAQVQLWKHKHTTMWRSCVHVQKPKHKWHYECSTFIWPLYHFAQPQQHIKSCGRAQTVLRFTPVSLSLSCGAFLFKYCSDPVPFVWSIFIHIYLAVRLRLTSGAVEHYTKKKRKSAELLPYGAYGHTKYKYDIQNTSHKNEFSLEHA